MAYQDGPLDSKGTWQSTSPDYLNGTQNYVSAIAKIIAGAQITNGGPIIMVQPENEYTSWLSVTDFPSPMHREYMAYVEQQFRNTGIVVLFLSNDNFVKG